MTKIEIEEEAYVEERNPLLDGARRVLLAGIGAVTMAQEEMEEFVGKLVERGEIADKDGRNLIKDLRKRRREKAKEVEESLERRVEGLLDRMNIPTKRDVDELSKKVSVLAEKVDELKAKQ
jgi:polyhydroxyalkanoate synthesis regulator phasin